MTSLKPATTAPRGGAVSLESLWPALSHSIDHRADFLVQFRRRLHAAPEASGEEHATTALIAQTLRDNGLEPRIMRDDVGVIVDIDLGAPSNCLIAIRAELDCVKVNDDKQVGYASTKPGLCHACGHDAHTTIALAAVMSMHESRSRLRTLGFHHNVRAIFQPAEETAAGALSMIEQGALENVAAILAVHVEPFLEAGVFGLRKGPLTSACKSFQINIKGRSGHSARPFQAIDPIPAAVNLIDLFYQLGPRSMDSRYPLALTVASINSGGAFNAIPDEAMIKGTLRTARVEDLAAVETKMHAIVGGVAQATGCEIVMEFPQYAPPTNNDGALIDVMAAAVRALSTDVTDGAEKKKPPMSSAPSADSLSPSVQWLDVPSLGAEDFAFYQQRIPGAIVRLGAALPDPSQRRPLHSSLFDINETALIIGAKFMARSALMAALH